MNPSEMLPQKKLDKGQWWGDPWGLVQGCTPVSPGCDNCWLTAMRRRFGQDDGEVHVREDKLTIPPKRKKPTVFTIWSDLGHEAVPTHFIQNVFRTIEACPQHLFIVLTKRPERMTGEMLCWHEGCAQPILPNLWLYTSAENQEQFGIRVPHLLKCPAAVRGVSLSPLLGPIDMSRIVESDDWLLEPLDDWLLEPLTGGWTDCSGDQGCGRQDDLRLDHIITECESGPNRRPCDEAWVKDIISQCDAAGVPPWVKQMSINGKVSHDMSEWPKWARRREWPQNGEQA